MSPDEVATLSAEKYAMADPAAIKLVMKARAADATSHDERAAMRTLDRAHRERVDLVRKQMKMVPR